MFFGGGVGGAGGWAMAGEVCRGGGRGLVGVTGSQPVGFRQLVGWTMIGVVCFSESPGMWVWIGAGIVVFSATYMARLESRSVQQP